MCQLSTKINEDAQVIFEAPSEIQFFKHGAQWFVYTEEDGGDSKIWCLGFSPRKIQDLLLEIRSADVQVDRILQVYSAAVSSSGVRWCQRGNKPRRSLDSVCLNSDIKSRLIDDIEDYLDPDTSLWYTSRGIPYRRGYLLHGKPGWWKDFVRSRSCRPLRIGYLYGLIVGRKPQ
jgi:hypothetical protein